MKYFIDFEATQFSGDIISVGCVDETGRRFYSLVKPHKLGLMTGFITDLTGITDEQVRAMGMEPGYCGPMGLREDIPIIAYQREANSGSQNLREKMVMQGLKMAEAPAEYRIDSMYGLIDSVAAYENSRSSLGYSIYVYAKEQYVKDSIKFLSINGVYPTDDTIADGSYPLSKIVYAVFRSDEPAGSPVRRLVAWLLTEEGQKAVMAGGYSGMK